MSFNIFEDKDDYIAEKRPFLGKLPLDVSIVYNWNDHIDLLNNHPEEHLDTNTDKFRIGLNNFHNRPSAPPFAKTIVEELSDVFALHGDKRAITNIAFTGIGRDSGSYPWHKDSMDVFLVQVIDTVGLKVEGINDEQEFDFKPGDYLWIPRGTHHQIFPRLSRVTFSFGIEGDPDPAMYF